MTSEGRQLVMAATVDMRLDANRRMVAASEANDRDAYLAAVQLHKDAEHIASPLRLKN